MSFETEHGFKPHLPNKDMDRITPIDQVSLTEHQVKELQERLKDPQHRFEISLYHAYFRHLNPKGSESMRAAIDAGLSVDPTIPGIMMAQLAFGVSRTLEVAAQKDGWPEHFSPPEYIYGLEKCLEYAPFPRRVHGYEDEHGYHSDIAVNSNAMDDFYTRLNEAVSRLWPGEE